MSKFFLALIFAGFFLFGLIYLEERFDWVQVEDLANLKNQIKEIGYDISTLFKDIFTIIK